MHDANSEPRIHVDGDWRPVRDALEHAYAQLGRKREASGYPTPDWNLAALVHQHAQEHSAAINTTCAHCRGALKWWQAYRCFDCKASLCERCAPQHFGPSHAARAAVAAGHQG